MAIIRTINNPVAINNPINNPVNSAYQVVLTVNGIRTVVNVFANSSSEAVMNAKNQVNPLNTASMGLVSVNAINACSVAPTVATVSGTRVVTTRNINNY